MIQRCAGWTLVPPIGAAAGGCLGSVVAPTVDVAGCANGFRGQPDDRFRSLSATGPGHTLQRLSWRLGDGAPTAVGYGNTVHRFQAPRPSLVAADGRRGSGTLSQEVAIRARRPSLGSPVEVTGEVENRSATLLPSVTIETTVDDTDGPRLTGKERQICGLAP